MNTQQKRDRDIAMANAVLIPISHLAQGTNISNSSNNNERIHGKEERLRAIISNLDTHQQTVRSQILAQPISAPTSQAPPTHQPPNITKIVSDMATKPQNYKDHELQAYLTRFQAEAASKIAIADLRSAPPAVAMAIERLNRLNAYDRHAAAAKEGYSRALKRYQSGNYAAESPIATGAGAQRYGGGPSVSGANAGPLGSRVTGGEERRMSAPVANMGFGSSGAVPMEQQRRQSMGVGGGGGAAQPGAPNIDASRDPRRRRTGS